MLETKIFSGLLTALAVLVALSPIIIIHELGHYLACRLTGIRALEFAFGFGKVLWSKKIGHTLFSVRAIPFGGFVNPAGEMFVDGKRGRKKPRDYEFASKKWPKKLFMVVAGATMNYVLAFLIFTGLALASGQIIRSAPKTPPVIEAVLENSPAEKYGLKPGDTILSFNGVQIKNWQKLLNAVVSVKENYGRAPEGFFKGAGVVITFLNGAERVTASVPLKEFEANKYLLGVQVRPAYVKANIFNAMGGGAYQCWHWTKLSITSIYKSFAAKKAPEVSGPVGIIKVIHDYSRSGILNFIWLIGLLSLAVGMFNLFPIPVLDGGYALMFLWEGVSGKPVSEKTVSRSLNVGFVLLIALVLYATFGDVKRIWFNKTKPAVSGPAEAGK